MTDVTVVGAGVSGLVCACELADRGFSVTVHEQSPALGEMACSWYAGGMLAPYCEQDTAETWVMVRGCLSIPWWRTHVTNVVQAGSLVLSLPADRNEMMRLARLSDNHQWVDQDRIRELEPDLGGFYGQGLYFPDEAHLDPRQALQDLVGYLQDRGGTVCFGVSAEPDDRQADYVIDCRGYAARDTLGELRGVRGEMMILQTGELTLARPVRLLHPRHPVYVVPRGHGRFMLGATVIENDERRRVSVRSVLDLLNAALLLEPRFGEAEVVEVGVDVRPAFDDNLPKLMRRNNVIYMNGLFRHGFLLSPAMAAQVAEALQDREQFRALPLCA